MQLLKYKKSTKLYDFWEKLKFLLKTIPRGQQPTQCYLWVKLHCFNACSYKTTSWQNQCYAQLKFVLVNRIRAIRRYCNDKKFSVEWKSSNDVNNWREEKKQIEQVLISSHFQLNDTANNVDKTYCSPVKKNIFSLL